MSDSPRWCGSCNRYGDHHTDRCPRAHQPVFQVERGCDAVRGGAGCGCTGRCHEPIDVVLAADYWRVVGERDEARRRQEEA